MNKRFKISEVIIILLFFIAMYSCKNEKTVPPVITTNEVTEISYTTAVAGGNLNDEGSSPVIFGGVCWDTISEPRIENNKTIDSVGIGPFITRLTMLVPNTVYFLRAYAVNSKTTGYGEQITFETKHISVPILTTTQITTVNYSMISTGGNVKNENGGTVTSRGVCWNTSGSPTVLDNSTNDGIGTGMFASTISGLSSNTVYFIRSYATNSSGTGYGDEQSVNLPLNLPGNGITDIDGNVYKTVKIGSQEWMAENLKTTHYADGSPIPFLTDQEWSLISLESGKAIKWYNNDISNKEVFGALYTWPAAVNGSIPSDNNPSGKQGACPTGWHIPSNSEWAQLETYLGGSTLTGGNIKEIGTVHWITPNTGASDISGFTALPGGFCWMGGLSESMGLLGEWWSTSRGIGAGLPDRTGSIIFTTSYLITNTYRIKASNGHGKSVRCLKD